MLVRKINVFIVFFTCFCMYSISSFSVNGSNLINEAEKKYSEYHNEFQVDYIIKNYTDSIFLLDMSRLNQLLSAAAIIYNDHVSLYTDLPDSTKIHILDKFSASTGSVFMLTSKSKPNLIIGIADILARRIKKNNNKIYDYYGDKIFSIKIPEIKIQVGKDDTYTKSFDFIEKKGNYRIAVNYNSSINYLDVNIYSGNNKMFI
jgi:hypothetical protein